MKDFNSVISSWDGLIPWYSGTGKSNKIYISTNNLVLEVATQVLYYSVLISDQTPNYQNTIRKKFAITHSIFISLLGFETNKVSKNILSVPFHCCQVKTL